MMTQPNVIGCGEAPPRSRQIDTLAISYIVLKIYLVATSLLALNAKNVDMYSLPKHDMLY